MRGPQHVVSKREELLESLDRVLCEVPAANRGQTRARRASSAATLDLDRRQLKKNKEQTNKKLKSSIGKIMKKWALEACSPFMDLTTFLLQMTNKTFSLI